MIAICHAILAKRGMAFTDDPSRDHISSVAAIAILARVK
jgi:hypothetical protein